MSSNKNATNNESWNSYKWLIEELKWQELSHEGSFIELSERLKGADKKYAAKVKQEEEQQAREVNKVSTYLLD